MMVGKGFKLEWKGETARTMVVKGIIAGLNEFHLEVEREAKAILQPGAGVITGTARRSIHAASPTYNWESDDVIPDKESPERKGTGGEPEEQDNAVVGTIGSGLVYAWSLHDGHGSFGGYHYITLGYVEVQDKLPDKLQKHCRKLGMI